MLPETAPSLVQAGQRIAVGSAMRCWMSRSCDTAPSLHAIKALGAPALLISVIAYFAAVPLCH